jgi:hypothetical protein
VADVRDDQNYLRRQQEAFYRLAVTQESEVMTSFGVIGPFHNIQPADLKFMRSLHIPTNRVQWTIHDLGPSPSSSRTEINSPLNVPPLHLPLKLRPLQRTVLVQSLHLLRQDSTIKLAMEANAM